MLPRHDASDAPEAVLDLTLAMMVSGNTEANVNSIALVARLNDAPHVVAPDQAEQRSKHDDCAQELLLLDVRER